MKTLRPFFLLTVLLVMPATFAKSEVTPTGKGFPSQKLIKKLGLSEKQVKDIKHIVSQSKQERENLQGRVKAANNGLEKALRADTKSGELWTQFDAVRKAKTERERYYFQQMVKVRDILTLEQRGKMGNLRTRIYKAMKKKVGEKKGPKKSKAKKI